MKWIVRAQGKYGAEKVLNVSNDKLKNFVNQAYALVIAEAAKKEGAEIVVLSNSFSGRGLAPRIGVKLEAGVADGVVSLPEAGAKFIVKKWTNQTRRERRFHVLNFLAHLIPGFWHVFGGCRILDIEKYLGFAGTRIASQEINVRRFLQLPGNAIRHFFLHLTRCRARPKSLDYHRLECEWRIF